MKLALPLLLAAGVWAQPRCAVSGLVTDDSTGKPLAAVKLFLIPESARALPSLLARSNDQGAFCFEKVDTGDYRLETQRTGYLNRTYGEGLVLAFTPSAGLPPLEVKLVRRAVLSGAVLDNSGEPLADAMVTVYRRLHSTNGDDFDEVESQETDDHGIFRFADLNPGTYFLGVKGHPEPEFEVPFLDAGGQPRQEAYGESFYSAAARIEDAKPIVIQAGKDVSGLLLTTRKVPRRHISGMALGKPDYIVLKNGGNSNGMPVRPDGAFYRGGLEPGVYIVESRAGNQARGRKEVDLTDGDADGVVVGLNDEPIPPVSIPVQFRIEGSGPPYRPSGGFLFLQRSDGDAGSIAQLNPDVPVQFNNVTPGVYHLVGPWGEEDYYVKRILLGGRAVAGRTLDLRQAHPEGIEIVMAARSASVEGRVTLDSVLRQAVTILLVNESGQERTVCDQNGHFRIDRAAPGKYRLFAIEGLGRTSWSPELATALQAKSVAVELSDGDKKQVELPLISSRELAAAVR